MRPVKRIALAWAVVAVVGTWLHAQQTPPGTAQPQRPVFRSTSDLVEVDVVVTDKKGAPVRGLAREDFQVTEDGNAQDIAQFSFVDIAMAPVAAPGAKATAPAVTSDISSNAKRTDSRLYVLVLDGFHVESSRSVTVRTQARKFIEEFVGPNDLAAVVVLGGGRSNQQFTSDKTLLVDAVEQFIGQKSQSATINIARDASVRTDKMESAAEDAEAGAKASEARIAMESIKQVCESLGTTQGHRRSIVLFSEGIEVETADFIGEDKRPGAGGQGLKYESSKHASEVLQAQQDMLVAARRANVALYTVDPRGNTTGDENIMQATILRDPLTGRPLPPPTIGVMTEAQRGQGTLRTFASETGGFAVVGTDNISKGMGRIVQANSSYYVLGYIPTNTAHDGAHRKIGVTVKPRDVEVVARKGYYAPIDRPAAAATPPSAVPSPTGASARMRELLASSLPVTGLGLRVTGGPVRSQTGGRVLAALIVEIDTKDLPFAEQNGQLANDIEIGFVAMDAQGKMQAANRSVGNLRLAPADRAAVTHGLRYVVEFPVSPGRYQVRVAVSESTGNSAGSALLDLDAPAFDQTLLSVGTVLLSTPAAQGMPTTGGYPTLRPGLPTPPTAVREFSTRDVLTALVHVLGADARKGGVSLTTTVRGSDGREVQRNVVGLGETQMLADKSAYAYRSEIPLSGLTPGSYVIAIEARSPAGRTASKSLGITVR